MARPVLTALLALAGYALAIRLDVAGSGGNATNPLQYGIMFEDINHSGDGGLYAELIQNRAFQSSRDFPVTIAPWTPINGAVLTLRSTSAPLSAALPISMNVAAGHELRYGREIGFLNPGWWGIDVRPQTYRGSFWVYGDYSGYFTASLQSAITNEIWASTRVTSHSTSHGWTQHNFTLNPTVSAPNVNNTFAIMFDPRGSNTSLNFNLISLFPPTYNNRPNGLRIDLMEILRGLSPSFLRMPGGNNVEGVHPPYRWKWNETIGPLTNRPGRPGTWGYQNTDGLGLDEYLDWCVDLNMEPVLAVWAGLYLDGTIISQADLGPYVQEVMNELEYILGSTDTEYGALRASNGHPEPWKLSFVEVGNEDFLNGGTESYLAYRFQAFYDAIKSVYPHMTVIASVTGIPLPGDAAGDYHHYATPDVFITQFNFFDQNTSDHKTLIGEYSSLQPNRGGGRDVDWSQPGPGRNFPWWIGTVAEAVFLLGAERNAASIIGAAYAPLFQNLNSYEWQPDLIAFTADPRQDVLSTSYHQIQLFSNTRMTEVLPVNASGSFGPMYWVAGCNTATNSYVFKAAVYNSTADVPVTLNFDGGVPAGWTANLTVMTAPDPYSYNYIGRDVVMRNVTMLTAGQDGFTFSLPNLSVAVLVTHY